MNQQNAGTERTQSGLGGSTSFSAKSHETAEQLKNTTRNSWTSAGHRESVAEHCWHVMLLGLLCADLAPDDVDYVVPVDSIGDPRQTAQYLITARYIESLRDMARTQNSKVIFMPTETSSMLSAVGAFKYATKSG